MKINKEAEFYSRMVATLLGEPISVGFMGSVAVCCKPDRGLSIVVGLGYPRSDVNEIFSLTHRNPSYAEKVWVRYHYVKLDVIKILKKLHLMALNNEVSGCFEFEPFNVKYQLTDRFHYVGFTFYDNSYVISMQRNKRALKAKEISSFTFEVLRDLIRTSDVSLSDRVIALNVK